MSCEWREGKHITQYGKARMNGFDKEMLLSGFQRTEVDAESQRSRNLLISIGALGKYTSKDRL